MTGDHEHPDGELKFRNVAVISVANTAYVAVDYIYDDTASEAFVGILVDDETPGEEEKASMLLDPEQALLLADRITRAAHLALETEEDAPDLAREYRRLTGHPAADDQ